MQEQRLEARTHQADSGEGCVLANVGEELRNLCRTNAIVSVLIDQWRIGRCSYEQAIEQCVVLLAAQNKALIDQLAEANLRRPVIAGGLPSGYEMALAGRPQHEIRAEMLRRT